MQTATANNKSYGVWIPAEVIAAGLDPYELAAYVSIAAHLNWKTGEAFPSYSTIAKKARMGRTKAINCVKTLTERGLLGKELRTKETPRDKVRNTSNLYRLPVREMDQGSTPETPAPSPQREPERNKRSSSFEREKRVTKARTNRAPVSLVFDSDREERANDLSSMFYSKTEQQESKQVDCDTIQSSQEMRTSTGESKADLVKRMRQYLHSHKNVRSMFAELKQQRGKLTVITPEPIDDCLAIMHEWLAKESPDLTLEIKTPPLASRA